ncbi:hypothetical protein LCGC14_1457110 [marine sediment metagenome]|uniref:4-hydroxy-3-methylbut-2-enyl diphosphate reductase n=1 Tax=marine sediment metagenome TaxID=412755 RepID=A0A0F9JGY2_9ZZZZ
MLKVRTAGKLGYCFGVSQAIEKAITFADVRGPLLSLGTLAHNETVVEHLREHNVEPIVPSVSITAMASVKRALATGPMASAIAITAHGAPPADYDTLKELGCKVLDCTCPIVRKAQAVVSQQMDGFDVVIFGDPDHQEVIGLNGWAGGAKFVGTLNSLFTEQQDVKPLKLGKRVGVISQTTQIPANFAEFVTALAYHNLGTWTELRVINTICPIVAGRVSKTRKLSREVDVMLVVGSLESANTANLAAVARPGAGADSVFIIQKADQVIDTMGRWWADGDWERRGSAELRIDSEQAVFTVGITAGTSTPIETVNEAVAQVKEMANVR